MPDVSKEIAIIMNAQDYASPVVEQATARLQAQANQLQRIGSQMRMAGVAMTAVGAAGLVMSKKLVDGAVSVESAYAKVNTMLGKNEDAYDDYNESVKDMIKTIPVQGGEIEALNGLYQVLSAGIAHGADATAVLEESMKAAVAGMTSTEVAVDALTSVINAYGLAGSDAAYVSDILFTAVKLGKTTFEELNSALGPVISISAQLGVGIEQVAASLATLTKAGVQTDIAGTALKATMAAFLKPSEDMQTAMESLGYSSGSMMLESLGLQGSLMALGESVGFNKEQLALFFPNIRALTAVLPLTGEMAATAAEDLEAMGQAAGKANDAFKKMDETSESTFTKLQNRIQIAKDEIADGMTPAMLKMMEAEAILLEKTAELNKKTNGLIGATTTYGSAVLTAIGPIVALYGQYMILKAAKMQMAVAEAADAAATGANTAAKTTLTAAIWANTIACLANPIFWIAIAIMGVVAALYLLYTHWDQVTAAVEDATKWFGNAAGGMEDLADKFRAAGLPGHAKQLDRIADGFRNVQKGIEHVRKGLSSWRDVANRVFNKIKKDAYDWGEKTAKSYQDGLKSGEKWVKDGFESVAHAGDGLLEAFSPPKEGPLSHIGEWGKNISVSFADGIRAGVPAVETAAAELAGSALKASQGAWHTLGGTDPGVIAKQFEDRLDELRQVLDTKTFELLESQLNNGKTYVDNFAQGMMAGMPALNAATKTFTDALNAIPKSGVAGGFGTPGADFKGFDMNEPGSKMGAQVKALMATTINGADFWTMSMAAGYDPEEWGAHMIDKFGTGIAKNTPVLEEMMENLIRQTTQDYMGFSSPPPKGPLRNIDQWSQHMVQRWGEGIRRAGPKAAGSVEGMLGDAGGGEGRAGPAGGIHITINARTDDPNKLARLCGQAVADVMGV